jgi:hypothetical protein
VMNLFVQMFERHFSFFHSPSLNSKTAHSSSS